MDTTHTPHPKPMAILYAFTLGSGPIWLTGSNSFWVRHHQTILIVPWCPTRLGSGILQFCVCILYSVYLLSTLFPAPWTCCLTWPCGPLTTCTLTWSMMWPLCPTTFTWSMWQRFMPPSRERVWRRERWKLWQLLIILWSKWSQLSLFTNRLCLTLKWKQLIFLEK